jgi:hypothetical protein
VEEGSQISHDYETALSAVGVLFAILGGFTCVLLLPFILSDRRTTFLQMLNESIPREGKIVFCIIIIMAWVYLFITHRKIANVLSQYSVLRMPVVVYAIIWSVCFMIFPFGTLISYLVVSHDIRFLMRSTKSA